MLRQSRVHVRAAADGHAAGRNSRRDLQQRVWCDQRPGGSVHRQRRDRCVDPGSRDGGWWFDDDDQRLVVGDGHHRLQRTRDLRVRGRPDGKHVEDPALFAVYGDQCAQHANGCVDGRRDPVDHDGARHHGASGQRLHRVLRHRPGAAAGRRPGRWALQHRLSLRVRSLGYAGDKHRTSHSDADRAQLHERNDADPHPHRDEQRHRLGNAQGLADAATDAR